MDNSTKRDVARASLLAALGATAAVPIALVATGGTPDDPALDAQAAPTAVESASPLGLGGDLLDEVNERDDAEDDDTADDRDAQDTEPQARGQADADEDAGELPVVPAGGIDPTDDLDESAEDEEEEEGDDADEVDETSPATTAFVPARGSDAPPTTPTVGPNPGPTGVTAPGSAPTTAELAVQAFHDAGYDLADARTLADYWGYASDYDAKVTKGKVLLGYIDFPPPAQNPGASGDPIQAFYDAGYGGADADRLATLWGYLDTTEAKIIKGKVILGIIDFPAANSAPPVADQAVDLFYAYGKSYGDARLIAEAWGLPTAYDAKIQMGKVLAGIASRPPVVIAQARLDEIGIEAYQGLYGNDIAAAESLAEYWGYDDPVSAKVAKGLYILDLADYPPPGR